MLIVLILITLGFVSAFYPDFHTDQAWAQKERNPVVENEFSSEGGVYQRMGYKDLANNPTVNIDHPYISGIDFAVPWAQVEPEEGKYDWEEIDKLISPWKDAGKKVVVNIITLAPRGSTQTTYSGHATPSWVFKKGAQKITIKERQTSDGTADYPLFWDDVYLREYGEFIEQFAKRYDGHPAISAVGVGVAKLGGLTVIDPKVEPQERQKLIDFYTDHGFSMEKWEDTIKKIVSVYDSSFKKTPVRLTLSVPFIFERGKIAEAILKSASFNGELADWASSKDVHLFHQAVTNNTEVVVSLNKIFNKHCGKTLLGAEFVNPIYGTPERNRRHMGDVITAVKNALGEGETGPPSCISYLNLYVSDITASNPKNSKHVSEWEVAVRYASEQLYPKDGTRFPQASSQSKTLSNDEKLVEEKSNDVLSPESKPRKTGRAGRGNWGELRNHVRNAREAMKDGDKSKAKSEILEAKDALSDMETSSSGHSTQISQAKASLDETIRNLDSGDNSTARRSFRNALQIIKSIRKNQ